MEARLKNLMGAILLLCLALQACGNLPVTQATSLPQPTQPAPTVVEATSTPTQPPAPTLTSTPTQIEHVTKPGSPSYIVSQTAGDCVEGDAYTPNEPVVLSRVCDNAEAKVIERPVTSDMNSYFPYLDIVRAQFGASRNWLFARIVVYDTVPPTGGGDLYYFFKLDLNLDGRDSNVILFSVKNLPQNAVTWTVNGVQAWSYVDGTITPIFDQGVGADPDLVWVRRSPKVIELAFKPDLLNGVNRFAWWAWAYQGALAPADVALVEPAPGLYQIDNTCAFGFNTDATALVNRCTK